MRSLFPIKIFLSVSIIFAGLLYPYFSYSQTTIQATYGGKSLEKGNDLLVAQNGDYILAGESESYGTDNRCINLIRVDASGKVIWSKIYDNGVYEMPNTVLPAPDGGYLVVGERYPKSGKTELAFIMKIGGNGNYMWSKIYDGGGNMAEALGASATRDGSYIITGRAEKTLMVTDIFYQVSSEMRYLYLFKINENGEALWSRKYSSGNEIKLTKGSDVLQTTDGGYVVAGEFDNMSSGDRTVNMALLKTDGNGNISWCKEYGGSKDDASSVVIETSDGGFIIGGETQSFGSGKTDISLIKTDVHGNVLWSRTYGGKSYDQLGSLLELSNGNIAIAGKISDEKSDEPSMLVGIIDKNGKVLSAYAYGDRGFNNAAAIVEIAKRLVVSGTSMSSSTGNMEMTLISTDLSGMAKCKTNPVSLKSLAFTPNVKDMTAQTIYETIEEKPVMGASTDKSENLGKSVKSIKGAICK